MQSCSNLFPSGPFPICKTKEVEPDGSQAPSTSSDVCFPMISKELSVPYAETVGKEKCECVVAGSQTRGAKAKGRTID